MVQTTRRQIVLSPLSDEDTERAQLVDELAKLCKQQDLYLESDQVQLCVDHLLYVAQVNQYMNLVRFTDLQDALVLHVLDSLMLSRVLPNDPDCFLDMGTGAGFPGIPLHILTDAEGVLLDSVGKKVDAVNAFASALGLEGIQGVHARLEDYAVKASGRFDLVTARAVGQLPLLLEYATPFLEDGGYCLVAKARPEQDELDAGSRTAEICGLELVGSDEFELPRELGHRTVLLYQKVDEPRIKLPRAVGVAKKNPLGSR